MSGTASIFKPKPTRMMTCSCGIAFDRGRTDAIYCSEECARRVQSLSHNLRTIQCPQRTRDDGRQVVQPIKHYPIPPRSPTVPLVAYDTQETYSVPPLVLDADLVAAIAAQWPEPPARTRGRAQTYDQPRTRIIRPEAIYDFSRSTTSALQLDLGPQAVSHVGQSFPSASSSAHIFPELLRKASPKSIGPFDNIPQPPPCGSPVIPNLNDLHRRPASHEHRAPVVVHPSLSPLQPLYNCFAGRGRGRPPLKRAATLPAGPPQASFASGSNTLLFDSNWRGT